MGTPLIDREVSSLTVLKSALKLGAIGGIIVVLIALQGMMQAFKARDIIGGLMSMGQMMLYVGTFAMAYIAAGRGGRRRVPLALGAAALAGLVSSVILMALVALGGVVSLGEVFVNATGEMYDLITFKQGLAAGGLYWVLLGLALGLVAAIVYLLPGKARRAVVIALIGVIACGLLQDLIRITFGDWGPLKPVLKFLYLSNGLTEEGALTLFVLIAVIAYLRATQGARVESGFSSLPRSSQRAMRWTGILIVLVVLLLLPKLMGLYLSEVLDQVGLYLLMGLGLNIVVGFAGLLDLGYVAFFAIGAYTASVLTSPELKTGLIHNWWGAVPFAVVFALFAGVLLGVPVLKMRGDYLAIVTLGFGEIIRLLALSDFLKPFVGGAQGVQGIPKPNIGPLALNWGPQEFYYIFLGGCILAAFVAMRLKRSRLGRAWMAVREDEDVAQAMGINLVATKLLAFGMGASFGGLSGAIFASKLASTYPASFNFIVSVNVLAVIIIGGMGSIPGVIVGALALVGPVELLREVGDYRYLFYGAVLVTMMLTRPEGLWPEAIRSRELREAAEEPELEVTPLPPAAAGQSVGIGSGEPVGEA